MAITWKRIYIAGGADVPIEDGGTGQSTAQAAIDALSAVGAATNEHVLTKDTASGNAIFKVATGSAADAIMWAVLLGSSGKTVAGAVGGGASYVHPNHSGDVTSVADGVQTIANKQTLSATAPITVSNTPTVIAGAAPVIAIPAATASVNGYATSTQITKLNGIETGAEVNNISDVNATDLTDGGVTTLHKHSTLTSGKIPIASTGGVLVDGPTPLAGTKIYYVAIIAAGSLNTKITFVDGILTAEETIG